MAERASRSGPPEPGSNPPLESFSPEQHRILAYASAIGSEFEFPLLLGAMGMDEETLAEEVERLVHRGVLAERAGGERFAFVEEEFRARIYRSLTESRLRVLHRKIGEVLERMNPHPTLPVLTELGRHYFLGKVPPKSYEYNRLAAEAARAAGDPQVAAHHLERVLLDLASLPGDRRAEQAAVAESLGNLERDLGNFHAADLRFLEALERIDTGSLGFRARLLLSRADVARESLDLDTAVTRSTEALRLFEEAGDRLGGAEAHRLLARVAFRRGAYLDSLEECVRALDLIGTTDDPRIRGSLSIDLGNVFDELGAEAREIAIAWYERAVKRLMPTNDWREISRAYLNMGVTVGTEHPQEGLDYLDKAQQAAERVHDSREVGRAIAASAELRVALGQIEDAERDNEQVGRLLEHAPDELGRGWVEHNRGLIAERRGLWEEAEHAFANAVETCRRYQLPADEAEAAFYLARVRYKTRDLEGARRAWTIASDLGLILLRPYLAAPFLELAEQLGLARPSPSDRTAPARSYPAEPSDGRGL